MDNRLQEQAVEVSRLLPRLMRVLSVPQADDPAAELPLAQMRLCGLLASGPWTITALGRELGISVSAVTQMADRLERSEMVERVPEQADKRCKLLRLTDKGSEIMQARSDWKTRRVKQALEAISGEDRDLAVTGLRMLLLAASATLDTDAPERQPTTVKL